MISITRSDFVYKTYSLCQGYFIRREMWKNILDNDDHKVLASMFKKRLIENYRLEIKNKMVPIKKARLNKWKQRADYQATLMMVVNEETPVQD